MLRILGAMLVATACLGGCASSTRVVANDKTSDAVKAKPASAYREVLLLPPKEDSRKVAPMVVEEIERLGYKVRLLDPSKPLDAPQGTGFVIDGGGFLLTCAHVVGEQKEATISFGPVRMIADVVKADPKADLALLKLRDPLPAGTVVLRLRAPDAAVALGEEVATLGYPLSRLLGNGVRMSRGILSAQSGLRDDATRFQISAEVHPGNSGGPLLDREGKVIGVVASTIDPNAVTRSSGSLPQNINFAIKGQAVIDFLGTTDARLATSTVSSAPGSGSAGLEKGVVKVQAGVVGPDADRGDKLLVVMAYQSFWDVWFRFRYFILSAVDYDTQETLFVAGQTRDNLISNESVVVHDTVQKLAKALAQR